MTNREKHQGMYERKTIAGIPLPDLYWLMVVDPLRYASVGETIHAERDFLVSRVSAGSTLTQRASHTRQRNLRTYLVLKRALDIILAASLLIILAPLMLIIALAVRLDSEGPAFFAQERVGTRVRGKGNKKSWEIHGFTVYKFRTMRQNADSARHRAFIRAFIDQDEKAMAALQGQAAQSTAAANKYKMTHDPRVTHVGAILRKTSLDELPQLWNVLRGHMSLVGPRPAIPYEVEMYSTTHLRRLAAQPGLTGMWQVTSRSSVDFDSMVELDVAYIERQSLWLDLKIIIGTPWAILSRKGAA